MFCNLRFTSGLAWGLALLVCSSAQAEDWLQFKFDARHSGNAPQRTVKTPLKLVGAVALSDAVFTAPVVAGGKVFVVDGSGKAFCFDEKTLELRWQFDSPGGAGNCNNVSSPAVIGNYLHFGTMAGSYFVLNTENGQVVQEIVCGDPIFSTPVVGENRVYFATLGTQVYALEPNGTVCWKWDYVAEVLGFSGDRLSGEDWRKHKDGRVSSARAIWPWMAAPWSFPPAALPCGWTMPAKRPSCGAPARRPVWRATNIRPRLVSASAKMVPSIGSGIGETIMVGWK